jgi:hypothetical protein
MDSRRAAPDEVARRLAMGWDEDAPSIVHDFTYLLGRTFETDPEVLEIAHNQAVLRMPLEQLKLRHFDNLHVLLVGGEEPDQNRLNRLKSRFAGDDRVLFAVAPTAAWQRALDGTFPGKLGFLAGCLPELGEMFAARAPRDFLKGFALQRVSRLALNPFDILKVPKPNMFYGRLPQLETLLQMRDTSWAIAGPARIGKSTVLHHYHHLLRRVDPVRAQSVVTLDFLYMDSYAESSISSRIASAVNPTRRAQKVHPSDLRQFLVREKNSRPGGRLELLFDEVDLVCESQSFRLLSECAKDGICRLILCGKINLFESLHDSRYQLHGRLSPLRLDTFKEADGRRLFLEPLRDLGFGFAEEDAIVERVLQDTSGYPHLIQYLGLELVRKAMECDTDTIDANLFRSVRDAFETAQFFIAPIQNIEDERAELIALSMLQSQSDRFTEQDIRRIAAREGLQLDEKVISAICRKLYVSNVLSWNGDSYKIATGGLGRYARKLGYFVPRLLELRNKYQRGARREGGPWKS